MKRKRTFLFTGGHLTPALAVAKETEKTFSGADIVFVGRLRTFDTDTEVSREKAVLTQIGYKFYSISAGRFYREASVRMIRSLGRIPYGIVQSMVLCMRKRPDAVVSFGGYVSVPVICAAWVLRIPIVMHEQAKVVGLANRFCAVFAGRVCVSYPEHLSIFGKKAVYTGLPIRHSVLHPPGRLSFRILTAHPILYITGGISGAVSMNDMLFPVVQTLLQTYTVIHQTGKASEEKALALLETLSPGEKKRYHVYPYIDEGDAAWIMHHARIIVSRSGANTVGEIALLGKVAVLIPLPWSSGNEQYENARILQKAGLAILIDQSRAKDQDIVEAINTVEADYEQYRRRAAEFSKGQIRNSSGRIVSEIASLLT